MKKDRVLYGTYFYGNEISDYGKKHHRVDYMALAKSFDCIDACRLMEVYPDYDDYWTVENGQRYYYKDSDENEYTYDEAQSRIAELNDELDELNYLEELTAEQEERIEEIENDIESLQEIRFRDYYDYCIISKDGAEILKYWTDEYVIYNSELDLYVWGLDHCGTQWSYVLTDIEFKDEEENI